ncbi:hypothetical protein K438DRAFT_1755423 [Mycena galopus ATCC 62051]|nr:hypothetical protein K438DRAFT_1755423 [Mycena galopus ATCC 62051]
MGTPPLDSYHDTKFSQPQNFDPVDLDAREGETLPSATGAITYPTCQTARTGQISYRASIKPDPERVQEQKDKQKCADKGYRERRGSLISYHHDARGVTTRSTISP